MRNEKTAEEILAKEVEKVEAIIDATAAVVTAAHAKYPDIVGEAIKAPGGSLVFNLAGKNYVLKAGRGCCSHYTKYVLSAEGKNVVTSYSWSEGPATLVARVIATDVAGAGQAAEQVPLSEEEITAFMRRRIEDGEWDAEDIPVRLARFGLMDPAQFMAEMAERIALRAEEAAE